MAAGFPLQTGLAANCFNIQLLQRIGPSKKLHGWLGLPLPSQSFICKYIYMYIYVYICIYMYIYMYISICPPTPLSIYPSFSSPTHQYLPIHPFFFQCMSFIFFPSFSGLVQLYAATLSHFLPTNPPWKTSTVAVATSRASAAARKSVCTEFKARKSWTCHGDLRGISGVGEHTSNFTAVYGRFIYKYIYIFIM